MPGSGAALNQTPPPDAPAAVKHWRNGLMAAYLASGLILATLVSRLPTVRDGLGLDHAQVGLLLLGMSAGSFISVSFAGHLVMKFGASNVMRVGATVSGLGLLGVGSAASILHSTTLTALILFIQGLGSASWNVASNVQGAAMERALQRSIMPALHGFFSIGTVVGAGIGAGAAAIALPLGVHYALMGLLVIGIVLYSARYFGEDSSRSSTNSASNSKSLKDTWKEPQTVLLGVLVLGMALAEGAAGDWVALALADGYDTSEATGALGYATFVTAMTLTRLLSGDMILRRGRVFMIRVSAVFAFVGLLLFAFGGNLVLAFIALAIWGMGVALTFPLAMSAASDDPVHAAARVSVVSTIGYAAFLGGPPLLGLLAGAIGLLPALGCIAVLVVVAFALSNNAAGYRAKTAE
ncbi:MFS transporter [Glutamicibacter uratoxydans]|uniref:MFS transporter n=1 Tax=Glutamicibacter uratoxydans TaxID=43667 RepID=A0A4Y4DR48_GLUUR|nr:MFS transporter [Glutamicibacter uratoxydans]GED07113.1 MFS transporter [Glutamicibacter uratoxydans]